MNNVIIDIRRAQLEMMRGQIDFGKARDLQMKKDKKHMVGMAYLILAVAVAWIFFDFVVNPAKYASRDYLDEVLIVSLLTMTALALEWMCSFFIKKNQEMLDSFTELLDQEEKKYVSKLTEIRNGRQVS